MSSMVLRIKQAGENSFPLKGILIKGASPSNWIKEIQRIGLHLNDITVYPLPGTSANVIWGCLVMFEMERIKIEPGKNTYCQLIHGLLFIPERATIFPALTPEELQKLLRHQLHVFHPEFGLALLEAPVNWHEQLTLPEAEPATVRKPADSVFIPGKIKSFQVIGLTAEQVLSGLEEKHFPGREQFDNKPLNLFEKGKLFIYRELFRKDNNAAAGSNANAKTPLLSAIESLRKSFSNAPDDWIARAEQDHADLERRNQKHIDRLLELLKTNPEEALKYAIPLDTDGTGRGFGNAMKFRMEKRWFDFSLFNVTNSNAGSGVLPGNSFNALHQQYAEAAQHLISQKNYTKAAFIYMKLLKNYVMAARTLEEGGYYQEAAIIYLKYCNDKSKAAACFEKASMVTQAIDLYKELNENEKVGDLYYSLGKKAEADFYFQKVVDSYTANFRYIKASQILRDKMDNAAVAQSLLIRGWRENKDAFNCLNNYLHYIVDPNQLAGELQHIHRHDVQAGNRETFLRVLKHEFSRKNEMRALIKDMAYEIIVEETKVNPAIISELRAFNKSDVHLVKDTIRFKISRRIN